MKDYSAFVLWFNSGFVTFSALMFFVISPGVQAGMIDKKGMKPWEICGLCHNLNGISRMEKFPKLAGQKAIYIEKQLLDFKRGYRSNDGGQMEAIVTEVDEENIPLIAKYFSGLEVPAPVITDISDETFRKANQLFLKGDKGREIPACSGCHVKSNKEYNSAPFLTAQHASYLEKQLLNFKDKTRGNDKNEIMQNIAAKLSAEDIKGLAQFIAQQKR
ncbi:MAG: c-type cytochrome [Methyloligellaceae bacterium]